MTFIDLFQQHMELNVVYAFKVYCKIKRRMLYTQQMHLVHPTYQCDCFVFKNLSFDTFRRYVHFSKYITIQINSIYYVYVNLKFVAHTNNTHVHLSLRSKLSAC